MQTYRIQYVSEELLAAVRAQVLAEHLSLYCPSSQQQMMRDLQSHDLPKFETDSYPNSTT